MRRHALLCGIVLFAVPGLATADLPEPDYSSVVPCDEIGGVITAPRGPGSPPVPETVFTVTVRTAPETPLPNAEVVITFLAPENHHFCDHYSGVGFTDENGEATFSLPVGGCSIGDQVIEIEANDVPIRRYDRVTSPDLAIGADAAVSLADFIRFATQYGETDGGCTDFNNSGVTGLSDFVLFAKSFGRHCSE
jgi:hypothetical protein